MRKSTEELLQVKHRLREIRDNRQKQADIYRGRLTRARGGDTVTEYTPTTGQVRQLYANSMDPEGFDRWLAQVKSDAWDEGYLAHRQEMNRATILGLKTSIPNPHRTKTDE